MEKNVQPKRAQTDKRGEVRLVTKLDANFISNIKAFSNKFE